MKKFVVRLVVSLCLLAAAGSTPVLADGGAPIPFCPGGICQKSGLIAQAGK